MGEPRTLGRSVVVMGVATAVSRAFGSVRVLVIAAVLGVTALGDAFQAANSFSTVLFELLAAGALSAVLVPTFVELLDRDRRVDAERVAGGVLGIALAALAVVSVIGVVAAPGLARLLTGAVEDPEVRAEQQELVTYLLRFFVPQILLYAIGTVATAVLHARRVFALPAAAPIGNTVVLVAFLVVFRVMAGPDPGLDLTDGEMLVLGLGGTLGVAAFVAVPAAAVRAGGFRLRPRWAPGDRDVRRLLKLSGWATLQHTGPALLLLTAIVAGAAVTGGVVAYQVAFFLFLAPYAVLAQPVHTAVLPRLTTDASTGSTGDFASSLRWALDTMAVALVPVSAACVALSLPITEVIAFGQARSGDGIELTAAALATLALGLFAYGAFLLLTRAWYVLGDSRTPGLVAVVSAAVGAVAMVVGAQATDGAALVAALGLGHSLAFGVGALWLALGLRRRTGEAVTVPVLPKVAVVSAVLGLLAWAGFEAWDPAGRVATLVALAVTVAVGGAVYLALVRRLGAVPARLAA